MDHEIFKNELDSVFKSEYKKITNYFKGKYGNLQIDIHGLDDVISEGFAKAWEKSQLFKEDKGASLTTWIYRIIDNLIKDKWKKKKVQTVDTEDFERIMIDYRGPDEYLFRKNLFNLFAGQVEKLPLSQRNILMLAYYTGADDQRIAQILNSNVSAVRANKSRGMKDVMNELGNKGVVLRNCFATMKDLEITEEEIEAVISDPRAREMYIEYFFRFRSIFEILQAFGISEQEFYSLILTGLEEIAEAQIQRKKIKKKSVSEEAFQKITADIFKQVIITGVLERVREK